MKMFFKAVTAVCLFSLSLGAYPSFAGEIDLLLQKLVDKNVLTAGEAQQISTETKEQVKAERRALLRLDDSSSDQIYFDVIAALARDKQAAKCPPWSKIPGRNFAVTLMGLCRADLVTVPPRPDLSFDLEYLEEKLGVYHHEHIVLKKKLSKSKKSRS